MSTEIYKHKLAGSVVVVVSGTNIRSDMFETAGGEVFFGAFDASVGYFADPDDADVFIAYLQMCMSKDKIDKRVKTKKGTDIVSARITKIGHIGTMPVVKYTVVVEGNDGSPLRKTKEYADRVGMREIMKWLREKEEYVFTGGENYER